MAGLVEARLEEMAIWGRGCAMWRASEAGWMGETCARGKTASDDEFHILTYIHTYCTSSRGGVQSMPSSRDLTIANRRRTLDLWSSSRGVYRTSIPPMGKPLRCPRSETHCGCWRTDWCNKDSVGSQPPIWTTTRMHSSTGWR